MSKFWAWMIFGISTFLLIASIVIPIIIEWKKFRWIFFIVLGLYVLGWIIYLIVFLVKLYGKVTPIEKIDVTTAIDKEVESIKEDRYRPDNFIPKEYFLGRYGEAGKPKTPNLVVLGEGSEMNDKRVSIINLNNRKETSRVTNKTEEEIKKLANLLAENPDTETHEEIIIPGGYGMGMQRIKRTLPSSQSKRDEIEQQEAETKGKL